MIIELGLFELVDFSNAWRKDKFRDAATECFEWALAHEVPIDLVQNEVGSFTIQLTLRDANGVFFADPVAIRDGMNVKKVFSSAIAKARAKRIKKFAKREVAARVA